MARKQHLDPLAVGLLLACCLFWGFQQVLVKATIAELPPVFQAAVRFAGASVLLGLWCRWRRVPLFASDGSLRAGLLAGALFAVEFALMYSALAFSTASRVTVFVYTAPFWVALCVPLVVRSERLHVLQWVGLALAFVAVVFAFYEGMVGGAGAGAMQWVGDALALGAGMAWGLTTVVIRGSGLSRVSAEKLLFYQVAVSSACLPLLSIALGEPWVWGWSGFAVMSIALQTVVGAFASFLAWMWLLGRYPATRISAFVFLTPVFALLFGTVWLHEAVSTRLLLALLLVAAGIVLVNRRPRAARSGA